MRKTAISAALVLAVSLYAWGEQPSLEGTWKATFADSISTGILYLILNVDSDGTVSGTLQMDGRSAGRISGKLDGNTFYFTLVQTVQDCPGSFSGSLTIEGEGGTGTYVGADCEGEHQNGVVSMVRAAPGEATYQRGETSQPPAADCLVSHQEENYVSWLCDAEGRMHPNKAEIFFLRTNRALENVAMAVWSGPREEWTERASEIISEHMQQSAQCDVYFNASYVTGQGQVRWHWAPKHFWKWWKKDGGKKFPSFCYTKEPWEADYVIVWLDSQYSVPYSFSVPVPQTSYVTGTTSGWVGGEYVQGTYSGQVYSTQTQTYSGSTSITKVTAVVYPVEANTRVVFESKHTGRWRWSKPAKDALIDCLKFIAKDLQKEPKQPTAADE
ncbi:MAG: hypothetical protein ACE5JX_22720 [Acidobacteriota bacterium]